MMPKFSSLGCCVLIAIGTAVSAGEPVVFNRDIRPILSDTCFQCHGPDEGQRQAGLRLDIQDLSRQPAESGLVAIVPSNIDQSELIKRVLTTDPDLRMPPPDSGKSLTEHQVDLLERWVRQGGEYQGHWAFIAPQRPQVPDVVAKKQVRNDIDRFILSKLEKLGFEFSPAVDRETLLRRVTLDLTGLPPTPQERDAFLQDTSPEAYERVVDRLLQSPHYGERMAIQWLDLARYADSNGYQIDSSRQQWPWRDWVIQAFNDNMPFDQFTVEQIAGDMLTNASLSQKVATGFNRNHRLNGEGGIIAEEWRVETVIDRVETTGLTWLGLTLNCCRCHDHKYDPITQREFYSLFSYFNNVAESGTLQGESRNTEPTIPVATSEQQKELMAFEQEIQNAEFGLSKQLEILPQLLSQWEPEFKKQIDASGAAWSILEPSQVISRSGASLTRQSDGSFLAGGENPGNDIYTIQSPLRPGLWSGFLLECFPDPSLPMQSLGRYPNGNFVLTRVEAEIAAPTLPTPNVVKFTYVEADYSQQGWDIQNTIGNDISKGWAVDGPTRKEICRAMFLSEAPFTVPENATITIRLVQESLNQHNIGRFRVSATGLARGTVAISGSQIPDSIRGILNIAGSERTPEQTAELAAFYRKNADGPIRQAEAKVAQAKKQRDDFRATWPTVMVMQEIEKPREAFILVRGQYDRRGDLVTATIPAVFPPLPEGAPNNRLGLAQWIAHRNNPLTARVWVNRIWENFMGTGIVKTSENFGSQADFPSHPELLDWLAVEFMEPTQMPNIAGRSAHAWDTKALQKLIVMSATYRQSASHRVDHTLLERDPENRLLGRGPRFRLSGEVLRDQALAISGLLTNKLGGPSVRPYMPDGVWDETSVYGDLRNYQHDKNDGLYRRTLYTVWKRTAAPPTMLLFDAPNREICTVKRSRTNTPLQALSLLNEVTFVEASRKLGERMMLEGGATTPERIAYGFQLVTARKPSDGELQILVRGWQDDFAFYQSDRQAAEQLVKHGDSASNVNDIAELAAYMIVGNVLLNLDECVTRE